MNIPRLMAFWLARSFPWIDVGPVDFSAFFWFAAALAAVTVFRIFIGSPDAEHSNRGCWRVRS